MTHIEDLSLFRPVETKSAPEIVFEELQNQILGRKYLPGDKLPPERTLMKVFGRSHPTIREALRLLESAGYIEVIPGGGAVVRSFEGRMVEEPLQDLLLFRKVSAHDVVEFIFAAEPEIAGYATQRRTPEDLAVIETLAGQLEKKLQEEIDRSDRNACALRVEAFFQIIREYHIAIAAATHNPLALIIWNGLNRMITVDAAQAIRKRDYYSFSEPIVNAHWEVLRQIQRRDRQGASDAMSACFDLFVDHSELLILDAAGRQGEPGLTFPLSQNHKASQAIFSQIRRLILEGKLRPGERLPSERALVEAFGKSRTSVREALKMLELKNYVTITRGSGTVVNDISTDEIERMLGSMLRYDLISRHDILEIRRISEVIAAEWAAARRTDSDLERIRETIRASEQCLQDYPRLIECGIDFTNAMTMAAHNDVVYLISQAGSIFLHSYYRDSQEAKPEEVRLGIIRQHAKIMHEIGKGSVSGARLATQRHLAAIEEMF